MAIGITNLLRSFFIEEDANCILAIPWPKVTCNDKLVWTSISTRQFSVGDYFTLNFSGDAMEIASGVWAKMWGSKMHDRLKLFIWRLLAGSIPTREVLSRRFDIGDTCCVLYGVVAKSCLHLFKECNGIRALAFGSKWGCTLDS